MDYKEKYEKVLKKLRGLIKNDSEHVIYEYEILERVPELKESDDEMIRKKLIDYFKDFLEGNEDTYKVGGGVEWNGLDVKDIIAWLEKMGDQKPAKWSEHQHKLLNYAISITADTEVKRFLESLRNTESRESAEWSEEDEKMLAEIVKDLQVCKSRDISRAAKDDYQNEIDWLKSLKNRVKPKQEWNEEDEQYLLVCKNALYKYRSSDQWDAGIIIRWLENKLKFSVFQQPQQEWGEEDKKMLESCCGAIAAADYYTYDDKQEMESWLKSLKNRTLSQSKQEWSEEDENLFEEIKRCVGIQYPLGNPCIFKFLKSLKDRYTWKPSEEQMEALEKECFAHSNYDLCRLLEDLKKLKG